jgi:hypothetical protein
MKTFRVSTYTGLRKKIQEVLVLRQRQNLCPVFPVSEGSKDRGRYQNSVVKSLRGM